eukprot:25185-Ditylum_brightwellii.AAC.1
MSQLSMAPDIDHHETTLDSSKNKNNNKKKNSRLDYPDFSPLLKQLQYFWPLIQHAFFHPYVPYYD